MHDKRDLTALTGDADLVVILLYGYLSFEKVL